MALFYSYEPDYVPTVSADMWDAICGASVVAVDLAVADAIDDAIYLPTSRAARLATQNATVWAAASGIDATIEALCDER